MSKFKTVSCNKYHKIIELHIINIFLQQKKCLTDIFFLSFFFKIAKIPLTEHTIYTNKKETWENATE